MEPTVVPSDTNHENAVRRDVPGEKYANTPRVAQGFATPQHNICKVAVTRRVTIDRDPIQNTITLLY